MQPTCQQCPKEGSWKDQLGTYRITEGVWYMVGYNDALRLKKVKK